MLLKNALFMSFFCRLVRVMLFLSLPLSSSLGFASADPIQNLSSLIAEYRGIPKMQSEEVVEQLMSNPLFSAALEEPSAKIKALQDKLEFEETKKAILKKQLLLGKIYKQAVLEVNSPNALLKFFLEGVDPIANSNDAAALPSIKRMSNMEAFYEILFLLMQGKDEVKSVAFELLKATGSAYPSTDSYARGLARYAALSAVDAKKFDKILQLYDALYSFSQLPTSRAKGYGVFPLATEISNSDYNPALENPSLRAQIVQNMLEQVKKRALDLPGAYRGLRYDLIVGVSEIEDEPAVRSFAEEILQHSNEQADISAVLGGLSKRSDRKWVFDTILKSAASIAKLVRTSEFLQDNVARTLADMGLELKKSSSKTEEASFKPEFFSDANPLLRRASVKFLMGLKEFKSNLVTEQMSKFLSDVDPYVRLDAIHELSYRLSWGPLEFAIQFKDRLLEMSTSDPAQYVKDYAKEVHDKIVAAALKSGAACDDLLKP